jgi:predicted  nucleic acid-binding Zn-ribbon protein
LSNAESPEGLQQAKTGLEEDSKRLKEKRRSLEEKARTLEEKARVEKLAIDKKLALQILEEENRTHNDAVRELEDKIANLEQQLKSSLSAESPPTQTASEPTEEISDDVNEGPSAGVLPQPEPSEVEVSQEGSKKKKRNLF